MGTRFADKLRHRLAALEETLLLRGGIGYTFINWSLLTMIDVLMIYLLRKDFPHSNIPRSIKRRPWFLDAKTYGEAHYGKTRKENANLILRGVIGIGSTS
eukprot:TRINITY_DN2225_c0_g3_i1.p1 TRINITY_DN2225_c0_g3~~TRINITY_DN2225_c0_g3_i1.p1  ORF type:complete len:100 (-),score=9.50 TRINITY_DN2225_c0_g3_i1:665-964(-)